MRKSDLVIYHYTEIDKIVIPANTNVRVYRVEDEEGPELHVYVPTEGESDAEEKSEVPESNICSNW